MNCVVSHILASLGIVDESADEHILFGYLNNKRSRRIGIVITNCEELLKNKSKFSQLMDLIDGMLNSCARLQIIIVATMNLNPKKRKIMNYSVEIMSTNAIADYASHILGNLVRHKNT